MNQIYSHPPNDFIFKSQKFFYFVFLFYRKKKYIQFSETYENFCISSTIYLLWTFLFCNFISFLRRPFAQFFKLKFPNFHLRALLNLQ